MSLIEDAKQAYAKDQLEINEDKEKEIKKFVEDGIQCIKEKFGDNLNIDVISDKEGDIVFLVDGLKMRVRRSQGYYSIYLVQICPKCGAEYEDIIINLKNIGRAIQEGHTWYDCEKILKEKGPVKELTTEEKLIEALRTFVQENLYE
jgi:homospermidine synthase